MLYASSETPVRGTLITLYTRLQHCEGHAGDLIELWKWIDDGFRKIAQTFLDNKCRATFTLPADFDRAEFRTIWPKQDDDHRRGRAEPVIVVPRAKKQAAASGTAARLPGPRVKLYASKERPPRGEVIRLHTRIGRCEGHEGDRIQLLRKLPGEKKFTKIKAKRVNRKCKAVFKITAEFDRAQFRTIWPQQDPAFRRGKSEPVKIVTRTPNDTGDTDPAPSTDPAPGDGSEDPAVLPDPTPTGGP
jgi:hypothetical protein